MPPSVVRFALLFVFQVYRLPVQDCHKYSDCEKCAQARDPYCGWCVQEGRWALPGLLSCSHCTCALGNCWACWSQPLVLSLVLLAVISFYHTDIDINILCTQKSPRWLFQIWFVWENVYFSAGTENDYTSCNCMFYHSFNCTVTWSPRK